MAPGLLSVGSSEHVERRPYAFTVSCSGLNFYSSVWGAYTPTPVLLEAALLFLNFLY